MAKAERYVCPGCDEDVVNEAPRDVRRRGRVGWAAGVDTTRLLWSHRDGEPLCPEMTLRGYQPCLPEKAKR